jgi:hypothetical protein
MSSVPFTLHVYGGLAECHGLIRPEGDCLILEFQVQDNFWGIIRGRPRSVRIPLADLDSVEMRGRWFGRRLAIKARSLISLAGVPGSKQGQVEFEIARADVSAAENLVAGMYE